MKKLLLILLVVLMLMPLVKAQESDDYTVGYIYKAVRYNIPIGSVAYMELLYAKAYGNDFIIYVDMYNADSVIISNHNYFLDRMAPFKLSSQAELDSLISWRKYYR